MEHPLEISPPARAGMHYSFNFVGPVTKEIRVKPFFFLRARAIVKRGAQRVCALAVKEFGYISFKNRRASKWDSAFLQYVTAACEPRLSPAVCASGSPHGICTTSHELCKDLAMTICRSVCAPFKMLSFFRNGPRGLRFFFFYYFFDLTRK